MPINGQRGLQVQAASALVDASISRADERVRRARADLRVAFAQLVAAQVRERELTRCARRLRDLAEILAKREAAGDAAGFDRLRAEREVLDVEADRATAAGDRARAQAALAGFFAEPMDASRLAAVPGRRRRRRCPRSTRWLNGRNQCAASCARSARRSMRRGSPRVPPAAGVIPEPEIVAGTKSSIVRRRRRRQCRDGAGGDPAVRPRPRRTARSPRRAPARPRPGARRFGSLRGRDHRVARGRSRTPRRRPTGIARAAVTSADQIERIAQVSYDAGERGILELLDAYRIGLAARVRQAALDAAVRQAEIELEFVSGWEIP